MTTTIRMADASDLDLIVSEAEIMNVESAWDFTWNAHHARDYLWSFIADESRDIIIVSRDGVPAGGAMIAKSFEFHDEPLAYVCKFWIVREHRRGDTSLVLAQALIDWAKKQKCRQTFVTATAGLNKVEQMLFVRLMNHVGFMDVGPVLCHSN